VAARTTVVESPLGPLHLSAVDAGLCGVGYGVPPGPGPRYRRTVARGHARTAHVAPSLPAGPAADRILEDASQRLAAYFGAGDLRALDALPVALRGTPFETRVWLALRTIPPGGTLSYADLARRVGALRAARAVGVAVGRNPLPLVLPCHRVVGVDGALLGYGGGLERKAWLLHHEGALLV
jgi:methylated-DNA-[protein]-cysteine S-methyltransferase